MRIRHRLSAAATGRRTGTGVAGREEDEWPAGLPALPRAPWEYAQGEPQGQDDSPAAPAEKPPWDGETGPSWFDPFSRAAAAGGPGEGTPLSAPAEPAPQSAAGPALSGSHLGMPIRVPQASLAPQLRPRADGGQQAAGGDRQLAGGTAPDADERSPEATRNLMVLMQQGWERGRVDDLDDPAGISDNGTE